MAVPWPFPDKVPLRAGYGWDWSDLLQRTPFKHGASQTPIYTGGAYTLNDLSIVLSWGDWAYWDAWFRYDVKDGAEWFQMPLMIDGVRGTFEVQWIGGKKSKLLGNRTVLITFSVQTRNGPAWV